MHLHQILICCFSLLLTSNACCCQKSASYAGSSGGYGGGFSYHFFEGNKFRMHTQSCTGRATGKGKYVISKDTIHFIYDKYPEKGGREKIRKAMELKDKIVIDFDIKYEDSYGHGNKATPQEYLVRIFEQQTLIQEINIDTSGILQVLVPFNGKEIHYKIHANERKSNEFTIKEGGYYKVNVYSHDFLDHIILDKTETFRLIKWGTDTIQLGSFDYPQIDYTLIRYYNKYN